MPTGSSGKWTTVFAENNPDTITALYAKDAVLWGTLSPTVRSDPAALKAYFVGAFQALPKATFQFGDQYIIRIGHRLAEPARSPPFR